MSARRFVPGCVLLVTLVALLFQVSCTGSTRTVSQGQTGTTADDSISRILELSTSSASIEAATGGSVEQGEFKVIFPAGSLPSSTQVWASRVFVVNSQQDVSLFDLTRPYVLYTPSPDDLELRTPATIEFKIDPTGYDLSTIFLAFWDGFNWIEVPSRYDATRRVLTSTLPKVLTYGTSIYFQGGADDASDPGETDGPEIVMEFVALKVMGNKAVQVAAATAAEVDRNKYEESTNFTVQYTRDADKDLAKALSEYLENAYARMVTDAGFRKPGPTALPGYETTWPVLIVELKGDYSGFAYDQNYIEMKEGLTRSDVTAHTAHHEFFHLVQYKTLRDAKNDAMDGLDWLDELTADAVGYYTMKGLGTLYTLKESYMGRFDIRLDHGQSVGKQGYEYLHHPFVSFILGTYGLPKFKKFFETFYSRSPKAQINLTNLDAVATAALGKPVSGRDGLFRDFIKDYFVSGQIVNQTKFLNLPGRTSGSPMVITTANAGQQAVIVQTVGSDFGETNSVTVDRLSCQLVVLRHDGKSGARTLTLKLTSNAGKSAGRIEVQAFKKVGAALQAAGSSEAVDDNATRTLTFSNFGADSHDVYVLMINTSTTTDDYRITMEVSTPP